MAGYPVFLWDFEEHGWCWNRAAESHHTEPSARWHGPFKSRTAAHAAARSWADKRWRPMKHDVLTD
jgi:hypothetical protein